MAFTVRQTLFALAGWALAAFLVVNGRRDDGRCLPAKPVQPDTTTTVADSPFSQETVSRLTWLPVQNSNGQSSTEFAPDHWQRTFQQVSPKVASIRAVFVDDPTPQIGMTMASSLASKRRGHAKRGSGFIWDQQGHIVTNAHVIRGGQSLRRLTVMLGDEVVHAQVVGACSDVDIAVLCVLKTTSSMSLPLPINIGSTSNLKIGQTTLAMGSPHGTGTHLAVGHVGGFEHSPSLTEIHFHAPVQPGYSGGPLTDIHGRLVGVIESTLKSKNDIGSGVGVAIAVEAVTSVVKKIILSNRGQQQSGLLCLGDPGSD